MYLKGVKNNENFEQIIKNIKKHRKKIKLREIYTKQLTSTSQNCQGMKNKESLNNCHRSEKAKET